MIWDKFVEGLSDSTWVPLSQYALLTVSFYITSNVDQTGGDTFPSSERNTNSDLWDYSKYDISLSIQIYSSFLELNLKLVFSGKESAYQCTRHKRCRFDPWVGKIPWRRAWQLTPVFLPRESHGQRSLVGYSPLDHKQSDTTEVT